MDYKRLIIRGISYSQSQSGAYALLLEQPESGLKLPIVIGSFEAQSISMGLEKNLHPPRPLTHDLFTKFVESAHYRLESVLIHKLVDGVFFSNINFVNRVIGDNITLDARTSDAVAMAVRFNAPIYTTENILNEAGILLDIETYNSEEKTSKTTSEPSIKSIEELQLELDKAVINEDFDLALKIQNEIKNRNKKID